MRQLNWHPRVWMNPILGVFRPYEARIIDQWLSILPSGLHDLYKAQIDSVNFVQRTGGDASVNFYRFIWGMFFEREMIQRGQVPIERRLACAHLVTESGENFQVDLIAFDGRFAALEFSAKVGRELRAMKFSITSINGGQSSAGDWQASVELSEAAKLFPGIVLEPSNVYSVSISGDSRSVLAEDESGIYTFSPNLRLYFFYSYDSGQETSSISLVDLIKRAKMAGENGDNRV